jgi:hypothetical protein
VYAFCALWSWRGSNPRPNKREEHFLHVYPAIGFRRRAGDKQPIRRLDAKFSDIRRTSEYPIPTFLAPRDRTP